MWFDPYIPQLEVWGFKLDPTMTSADGHCVSYQSDVADDFLVKQYFKTQGFINLDRRNYMAHTGNPHVNLHNQDDNTVQISWWVRRRRPVGISFLKSIKERDVA